jgi:ubiquinone/menaquinone biosynthesis C-methylase UbiE
MLQIQRSISRHSVTTQIDQGDDSLFEDVAWLYAFCREYLFRDDTERIIAALWPAGRPVLGTELIELGCGPGFYSRQLARRFPEISVIGADRSVNQLAWAQTRAAGWGSQNCAFARVNVLELPFQEGRFGVLVASRLFTVLPDQARAVSEIYRVLKSGGRCFIAEPRYSFWASIPLVSMWLLAKATHFGNGYREPRKASVFSAHAFRELFATQPWKSIRTWQEGRYQYALCEKS